MNDYITAYIMIIASVVLFSSQFIFQRRYNSREGADMYATYLFSFLVAIVKILLVVVIYGASKNLLDGITVYGAAVALLSSVNGLLNAYFSANAFRYADMSLYSMFMMLGGMALPFVFGILRFGEPLSAAKIVCCVMIAAALLLETSGGGGKRGAAKYYIGVFITNGLSGVFATYNQNPRNYGGFIPTGVPSETYLMLTGFWSLLLCGICLCIKLAREKRKIMQEPKSSLPAAAAFGLVGSLGNLFILLALRTLDASVQYPMITGGTIVVSTLVSMIPVKWINEKTAKLSARNYIAVAAAVIASVIIAL